jgi:hypothetical protein
MIELCLALVVVLAAFCAAMICQMVMADSRLGGFMADSRLGGFMADSRLGSFVPQPIRCSGGLSQSPISYGVGDIYTPLLPSQYHRALPQEITVRDGTVAPLTPTDIPNMVARGLGAGSAAVAEYMREDANPATGITRLHWSRAMADRRAGAAARARAANPAYQLLPGQPGSLVPETDRYDRPMSLPITPNLAAGYADGGMSPSGYNSDYATDGPFGTAQSSLRSY